MKITRHILGALLLVLMAAAGLAFAGVRPAFGGDEVPDHRVTICHHVEGNGNTGNGYNIETVDKDSISTLPNGHDGHALDLIPPFTAGFTVGPPPKQWNAYAGKGDFSLIATNCAEPDTTSTETTTNPCPSPPCVPNPQCTVEPCNPPPPPPGDRCPPGMFPTNGKDGEPGNDECEFPPTETQPPVTTTSPPTETTTTETTTSPETTTTITPTTSEPTSSPPAKPKPPKAQAKPKPKPHAKPKPPPVCPPGQPFNGTCGVQGSG